ncbi:MAG: ACT domain-containing protein [Marinobacter sp.]|nr:ACT domain-containing protein [Marinobacter sp.]
MQAEPAALERLCQVIRVRGFEIEAMSMGREQSRLLIDLSLRGERPLPMLMAQLEKLHTVLHVAEQAVGMKQRTA